MDFSGLSHHHNQGQSHHQSFRNSSVPHSLFGSPSSLFGSQPTGFGSGGSVGNGITPGNQFNFPLRSRQQGGGGVVSGSSLSSNQYPVFRGGNEGVLRTSIFGTSGQYQSQQNLIKSVQKSPSSGQHNHRNNRHNGKTTNGKDKSTREITHTSLKSGQSEQSQQQYRIFKRGDTIPGISSPVVQTSSSGSTAAVKFDTQPISHAKEVQSLEAISETQENDDILNDVSNLAIASSGSENVISSTPPTAKENLESQRTATGSSGNNSRTSVSLVSEIAKFHGLQVEYRLVKEAGPPHAPTFTVNLTLGTEEYQGCGSSIKRAQHAAAMDAIENTSFLKPPPRTQSKRNYLGGGNGQKRPNWALIQLTTLADDMKQPLSFALQPMAIIDPFYRREPPSVVSVHFGDRVFTGEGHTFNAAKNTAAMIALKTLIRERQEMELARMLAEGTTPFQLEERNLNVENKSPISIVHEMAMKRGLTVSFDVASESGPPHMKVFTVQCIVGELQTEGQGSTKQQAKKISSEMMMSKLREIHIPLPNAGAGNTLKAIQRGFSKPRVTKKKATPVLKDVDKQLVSPISKLLQIAHTKKYKEPEFRILAQPPEASEVVPAQGNKNDRRNKRKKMLFTMEVSVGSHVCQGSGMNKKSAKKAAADAALIALGCGPTLSSAEISASTVTPKPDESSSHPSSPAKLKHSTTSPRQIVPGVLVLKSEASPPSPPMQSAVVAEELKRVNSSLRSGSSAQEGIDKLNYLAQLMELKVSFSDFPKKNEYLSVVSFGAHVAHGIGATLEEARNMAAQKILDELTDIGLDSVANKTEGNSVSCH